MALEEDRTLVEVEQGSGSLREAMIFGAETWREFKCRLPCFTPHPHVDASKFVWQETFPLRNLLGAPAGHMLSKWHGIWILLPSLIHKKYWPRRIIERTLALKRVLNWSNIWQFIYTFFPVSSMMGPCCASFLKYILTFTKNDYQFSWNAGTLEIDHDESTWLLASSFPQKALLTFDISVFFLLFNSQTQRYADLSPRFCP